MTDFVIRPLFQYTVRLRLEPEGSIVGRALLIRVLNWGVLYTGAVYITLIFPK